MSFVPEIATKILKFTGEGLAGIAVIYLLLRIAIGMAPMDAGEKKVWVARANLLTYALIAGLGLLIAFAVR